MCGIAGIFVQRGGPPPEIAVLARMASTLSHRGPDALGVYRDRRAGLGHARLAIVDVAGGRQPLPNEDERIWVVFNGEIYEHVELRRELEAAGHRFRTRCDTEVIVHAYEQWGEEAFARLDGQFAFALWDSQAGRLVLARDRLGVRPLYVAERSGRVTFASEVKALFAGAADLPRKLDPLGLQQAFTCWGLVAPRTVFAGVEQLEPGHYRIYDESGVKDRAYWAPRFPERREGERPGTLAEAADLVRAALDKATTLRMLRADVPVGSYLSGGLDSSLVAALGRRAKGDRFRTFSVRFSDPEYDETRWQREMVNALGSEHFELVVSESDIAAVFPEVVRHAEQPLLRTAPAPLFLLSRLVRDQGVKVVLTGEGADEVFAGYDLFREARVRRFWAREPSSRMRPRLLERLYPYMSRSPVAGEMGRAFFGRGLESAKEPGFSHQPRWRATAALQRLFSAGLREELAGRDAAKDILETLPPAFARWSPLAQDQYLEIRTLLSGYLLSAQGDRMLMAHSVEGRFPFLDPDVVELAAALPDRFKLAGLDEKRVLKHAAGTLVPRSILERKKQPYRAPDALSFVRPAAPAWVQQVVERRAIDEAGVFDPRAIDLLFKKLRAVAPGRPSNTDDMAVVGVLSTQLLHEELLRRPAVALCRDLSTLVDKSDARAPSGG